RRLRIAFGRGSFLHQYLPGRHVQVVELSRAHRPEKRPHAEADQHQGHRDQHRYQAHGADLPGARDPAASGNASPAAPGNASGEGRDWGASGRVRGTRIKRSELSTTRMELVDMPMA